MAKKTYRTYFLKSLDFHFSQEDGQSIEVVFRGGIQVDSTAKYTTSDEKVQKLLEATALFNKEFYLEKEEKDEVENEEKKVAKVAEPKVEEDGPTTLIIDQKTFRNIQEMRSAMTEYVAEEEIAGKKYPELLRICKEKGLDYKIVKDK